MPSNKLKKVIEESKHIVFLGGAGVSTESNIPDFRSVGGLYTSSTNKKHPPEYMLSYTCFTKDTEDFFDYYKSHIIYQDAQPNKAHFALSRLEKQKKLKAVITQNIDGLHQKAGSEKVLELHGSVHRNYCIGCHKSFTLEYVLAANGIPRCDVCANIVRPDVVLYEEGLDGQILQSAAEHVMKADTLIVGGTSLLVYPAAGLINYYKGNNLVIINKSDTPYDDMAFLRFHSSIGELLDEVIV